MGIVRAGGTPCGTPGGTPCGTACTNSLISWSVRVECSHPGNGIVSITRAVPGVTRRGKTGHAGMRTRCRCAIIGSPRDQRGGSGGCDPVPASYDQQFTHRGQDPGNPVVLRERQHQGFRTVGARDPP